jgi:hypothetical protein
MDNQLFQTNLKENKMKFLSRLLPPYTGNCSDTVFGVSIYGNKNYNKKWFRYTFKLYHNLLSQIDDLWYFFHYRFINRIHIVKTNLKPGWHDVDEVMFHACFSLLGRFVEKELGIATVDYTLEYGHYRGYRIHAAGDRDEKAIDLWLWYKFDLPKLEENYNNIYNEIKDEKLQELIDIRERLWT